MEEQNYEIIRSQAEGKACTWNMFASLGLRLRQHCLPLSVKEKNFEMEVLKTMDIAINPESQAF